MKISHICYLSLAAALTILLFIFNPFSSSRMTAANPFDFGIAPKENLTQEDYLHLQEVLSSKQSELETLVRNLYPTDRAGYVSREDFIGRCLRGVRQILIDPKQGWFPEVRLEKINAGGDRCIVTSVPYLGKYPELAREKT